MAQLFDEIIRELRSYIKKNLSKGIGRETRYSGDSSWPASGSRDIVLRSDLGIELGSPAGESVSFLMWTGDSSLVSDGIITLLGPDINECSSKNVPFGRVVLVKGSGFNAENIYDRYREMDHLRYDVSLKGYMMRAVSQYMREWSRVSKEAISKGFSLLTLGGVLIDKYRKLNYIDAVEILFVTSSKKEVRELRGMGERVMQYINAMRKMKEEISIDCDNCEYQAVCEEVDVLKKMRNSIKKIEKCRNPQ